MLDDDLIRRSEEIACILQRRIIVILLVGAACRIFVEPGRARRRLWDCRRRMRRHRGRRLASASLQFSPCWRRYGSGRRRCDRGNRAAACSAFGRRERMGHWSLVARRKFHVPFTETFSADQMKYLLLFLDDTSSFACRSYQWQRNQAYWTN
jgi:hypothetical protein